MWFANFANRMDGISVRQFAKLLKVSDTAVNKAISKGYIVEGHNPNGGRHSINYDVALKEWNSRPGAKELVLKVDIKTAKEITEKAKVKKDFIVSDAEDEESELKDDIAPVLKKGAKINDVALVEAFWKAKKSELLVAELNGTLVKKDTVFKQLFQLGNELRAKFQAISTKNIDNIIAAYADRNKAEKILSDAINEALESISIKNVKI